MISLLPEAVLRSDHGVTRCGMIVFMINRLAVATYDVIK
jgi:hypothetical protein